MRLVAPEAARYIERTHCIYGHALPDLYRPAQDYPTQFVFRCGDSGNRALTVVMQHTENTLVELHKDYPI